MPIQECTLPDGGTGWRWGDSGKCYADRTDAEKQARAAYANGYAGDTFALDRASVRTFDQDGHLHVELTNISKAAVNEYFGREIPDWQSLGLDADRRYKLLRDPQELQKAADTFSGKPLLLHHKPVTADDHAHDLTVGSVTSAIYDAPYLKAALDIWDGKAIRAIQSGSQKELSSGYRYRADMTPGTYAGVKYDGVMRDISGNHVALVKEGRAGPDVVVGDSALATQELSDMATQPVVLTRKAAVAQGAIIAYLRPKLAADAKVDVIPALRDVTAKNYKEKKAAIVADLQKRTVGKLAEDAKIDDLALILDALDEVIPAEALDVAKPESKPPADTHKVAAEDKDKDDDEDDKDDEEDDDEDMKKKKKRAMDTEKKDMVTKSAMDSAIAAAVKAATSAATKAQRDIRDAENDVRPRVGELAMAHDSAEDVYRTALTNMGVDVEGVPPSAFKALFKAVPSAPAPRKPTLVAQDAADAKGYAERFPNANRLKA